MLGNRARLTLPDVLFVLMSLAFVGALWPVVAAALQTNAGVMSTGSSYIYQLLLPVAILVLFSVIYLKAVAGGAGR